MDWADGPTRREALDEEEEDDVVGSSNGENCVIEMDILGAMVSRHAVIIASEWSTLPPPTFCERHWWIFATESRSYAHGCNSGLSGTDGRPYVRGVQLDTLCSAKGQHQRQRAMFLYLSGWQGLGEPPVHGSGVTGSFPPLLPSFCRTNPSSIK